MNLKLRVNASPASWWDNLMNGQKAAAASLSKEKDLEEQGISRRVQLNWKSRQATIFKIEDARLRASHPMTATSINDIWNGIAQDLKSQYQSTPQAWTATVFRRDWYNRVQWYVFLNWEPRQGVQFFKLRTPALGLSNQLLCLPSMAFRMQVYVWWYLLAIVH